MSEKKRTPTERESDLQKIAALYLRGKTQADIAADLTVTQQQVSYDLKEIHKRWRESTLVSINEAKHRELSRIDNLETEYWNAWARSCEEKTKTRTEKIVGGAATKASIEKDTMLGNPAYLSGVAWCIEQRCKIFGIYEATKISFDWRKAAEEQGIDAGSLFERMVNAYIVAVNPDTDREPDR